MKALQKDSDKVIWDQTRNPTTAPFNVVVGSAAQPRAAVPKLMFWLILFVSLLYFVYTLKLVSHPHNCATSAAVVAGRGDPLSRPRLLSAAVEEEEEKEKVQPPEPTNITHVAFGIAASAKLWAHRKNYIKTWYNTDVMQGVVWLDGEVKRDSGDETLPPIRISGDTSRFSYRNKQGHRSAIRISRIISETLRLGLQDVRWFVLGDDDTVFVPENLVRVLQKYDHNQYYYIGSSSESHLQNIYFSYAMAYGGGGFAVSYPLAVALEKMQDRCIQRYPALYGSDDRMQACMAELGVPLTKELGFHQYDVYGNLFGLLTAHPVTPFVSMHHLDVAEPIFPNVTRVQAIQRLKLPMKLDSAGLMQQSICYDNKRKWTVTVSWGYAVQIIRGILSPREMEMPTRTFLNWYKRADYTAYAFNTRPVARNPCQKPFVFYLVSAKLDAEKNETVSEYLRHDVVQPLCKWKMVQPSTIQKVVVFKKPDPQLWNRSPRRNCCRILNTKNQESMVIDVGVCREDEVTQML